MNISESILRTVDKIFDGNCILFVGAGFSLDATDINGDDLKSSKELKDALYEATGLDKTGPFHYAVETYIDEFGESALIKLLRNYFLVSKAKPKHEAIVNQNWRGIYTTNYDNLIETVFSDSRRHVRSTTFLSKPSSFSSKRNLIVHLNGFIEHLNEHEGIPEDFLLTDLSYVTSKFVDSDWYHHFKSDLITSEAVIFIGFSMQFDLDLSKIIYNSDPERREKILFVVWENEPEPNVKYLEKFGIVLKIGTEKFAKILAERQAKYIPKQTDTLRLFSFQEFKLTGKSQKVSTENVYDLLFFGKLNQGHIESSLLYPDDYKYFIRRSLTTQIIKSVEEKRNIIITSDLGNGKSLLIDGLKVLLHQKGYKIFHFQKWLDTTENELQKICEKFPDCILIIESYNHNIKAFDFLQTRRTPNTILITSERSAVHETTFPKLDKYFSSENLESYNVDRLLDEEIKDIVELLNHYSLWGDHSVLINSEKDRFIRTKCKGSLRILLLELIKSKSLLDRFKELIDTIAQKRKYFEAVVLILTSNLFNINLDIEEIISILNYNSFRNQSFARDPAIREIIDFDSNSIRVKSSVLSQIILAESADAYSVVNALLRICQQLDLWSDNYSYKSLLREYVSFSNINTIIKSDSHNYSEAMDYYFDELRNLKFCKENPHFWLQFGIWNIEKGNLGLAKQQLATAYSYAHSKKVDTYQLDNQYARYLLLDIIASQNSKQVMAPFKKAHKILTNNLSPNKLKYYPYKVAQQYVIIFDKFYKDLAISEREEFRRYLNEMIQSIKQYIDKTEDYRVKQYALKTLQDLKARVP